MSTCTYCGKELSGLKHIKNVTYFELYGLEFCFECYGYAAMFCTSPDDIDRFTIEELKAICNHDEFYFRNVRVEFSITFDTE